MKPYIGLVSKESDTSYGIVFPDAPGCFSAADTMDEIFAMASEALAGWTEGMRDEGLPFPKCRDLRADRSLAELWSDTVIVIAVPAPLRAGDAVAA